MANIECVVAKNTFYKGKFNGEKDGVVSENNCFVFFSTSRTGECGVFKIPLFKLFLRTIPYAVQLNTNKPY